MSTSDHRVLGQAEARLLVTASVALLGLAAVGFLWPWLLAIPFGVVAAWLGTTTLARALRLLRGKGGAGIDGDPGEPTAIPIRRRRKSDEVMAELGQAEDRKAQADPAAP
jgi:hypothetical protein